MVVDTQAIDHPPKISRILSVVCPFPLAATAASKMPHTAKQPML
jgi:hypothetical protein